LTGWLFKMFLNLWCVVALLLFLLLLSLLSQFSFSIQTICARAEQICNNLLFINNNKNFVVFLSFASFSHFFKLSFLLFRANRKEFRYPVATPCNWARFQRLCCNQSYENWTNLGLSINEETISGWFVTEWDFKNITYLRSKYLSFYHQNNIWHRWHNYHT